MSASQPNAALELVDREGVRTAVDQALLVATEGLRAELAPFGADSDQLLTAVQDLVAGGKRLRAAFCYWSWRAHGGEPDTAMAQVVAHIGAAVELFQASALFHDDVMDASHTRRGQPAAHIAFAQMHSNADWSGDPRRFGENAAILLGDLCLIASHRELAVALAAVDPGTRAAASTIFGRMQTEVTAGQYLDVLAQSMPWGIDFDADEARARAVIRSKSASYSVQHPVMLGAVLAGADDTAQATMSRFGLPLGEAFQLRDDILGVFGDPRSTGKPAGDDLREGKRTVLVGRAMRHGGSDERAELVARLGDPHLGLDGVEQLRRILINTGAVTEVETLIGELCDQAFAALDEAPLREPGARMLALLAHAAVDRQS